MSGRKLAILLFLLGLLLAGWRYQAIGRRLDANIAASRAERNLAAALRQFGGSLPRRLLEDQVAHLEKARKRDPASVEAAVSQAGYLFLLRRYEQAEKVYFEALALEERAEIYGNLARLYLQQDRPGDAIEPLKKAIRIDPQMAEALQPLLDNAERAVEKAQRAQRAASLGEPVPESGEDTAGLFFSDDFESGSLSRWSQVVGGAANRAG